MIRGRENLISWMQSHKHAHWMLYSGRSKGSHILFKYDDSFDINSSIEQLQSVLDFLESGTYYITCKKDKEHTKQLMESVFLHLSENQKGIGVHPLQQEMMQGPYGFDSKNPEKYINEKIEVAIDRFKKEREIDDLKKENNELKREMRALQPTLLQSRLSSIIPEIKPYISGIMENMGIKRDQTSIAVSGHDPDVEDEINNTNTKEEMEEPTPEEIEAYQERLRNLLEQWYQQDPEYLHVVERLVTLSRENPGNYQKAVKMLDKAMKNPTLFSLI